MNARWRSAVRRGLPIAVSLAVLLWLLGRVDVSAVGRAVDVRVAAVMIPAMLAFGATTLWLEATSIHRLVPRPPPGFDRWTAARIKCASYLPGIVHYMLGVGGLAVLLRRRAGLPLAEALGLVVLISSIDLVVVLSAASASAAVLGVGATGLRVGIVALVVATLIAGLAVLRAPSSLGPLERLRDQPFFAGFRRVTLARLAELLALRVLFSACFVAACASAFAAFEIAAPPAMLIGGILLVAMVSALPIAVAGLGTSQAAFVYLFASVAPPERLLAMSLVLSFGFIALRTGMGLCFARELTREAFRGARATGA